MSDTDKNEDKYAAHRDPSTGRFQPGNPGGPGAPRVEYEPLPETYYTVTESEVTPGVWRSILRVVIADALQKRGHRSREFLARYVMASADRRHDTTGDTVQVVVRHIQQMPQSLRDAKLDSVSPENRADIAAWIARAFAKAGKRGAIVDMDDLRQSAWKDARKLLQLHGLRDPVEEQPPMPFAGEGIVIEETYTPMLPDDAPQVPQGAPKPDNPPKDTQPARSKPLTDGSHLPESVRKARQAAAGASLLERSKWEVEQAKG